MLHLNRKRNQVIYLINNETKEIVTINVLEIKGKTVKLGFENDSHTYTILRKEIYQAQQGVDNPNPFYNDRIPVSVVRDDPSTVSYAESLVQAITNASDASNSTSEAA